MNDAERIEALETRLEKIERKINLIKIGVDKLVSIQDQKSKKIGEMKEKLPHFPL